MSFGIQRSRPCSKFFKEAYLLSNSLGPNVEQTETEQRQNDYIDQNTFGDEDLEAEDNLDGGGVPSVF